MPANSAAAFLRFLAPRIRYLRIAAQGKHPRTFIARTPAIPYSDNLCLVQNENCCEGAMVFAEAGIPVGFIAMPNIGSTSPAKMGDKPQSDIRERARHRFEKILVEHQPDPLPEDIQIVLQNILKAAESQEANEGA